MVVVPSPTAVTSPVLEIVATEVLELVHEAVVEVIFVVVPSVLLAVQVICIVVVFCRFPKGADVAEEFASLLVVSVAEAGSSVVKLAFWVPLWVSQFTVFPTVVVTPVVFRLMSLAVAFPVATRSYVTT